LIENEINGEIGMLLSQLKGQKEIEAFCDKTNIPCKWMSMEPLTFGFVVKIDSSCYELHNELMQRIYDLSYVYAIEAYRLATSKLPFTGTIILQDKQEHLSSQKVDEVWAMVRSICVNAKEQSLGFKMSDRAATNYTKILCWNLLARRIQEEHWLKQSDLENLIGICEKKLNRRPAVRRHIEAIVFPEIERIWQGLCNIRREMEKYCADSGMEEDKIARYINSLSLFEFFQPNLK